MQFTTKRHLMLAASAAVLVLTACAPEAPKPEAVVTPPPAPAVADPAQTSLTMAADPVALGFDKDIVSGDFPVPSHSL